jgi:signal transduction histidine kinase
VPTRPRRAALDAWDRYLWVWHLAFALVLIAVTGLVALEVAEGSRGWPALPALVGLGLAYLLVGRRALTSERTAPAALYFTAVLALFGIAFWFAGETGYLLFALLPQVFMTLGRLLRSVPVAVALFAMVAVEQLVRNGTSLDTLGVLAATVLVPLAFSVLVAIWVHGIIRQSVNRGELIAELERTRGQLAAERHEAGIRAERERLSAEIHDTLSQGFTSILMIAQAARAGLDPGAGPAAGQLDIIVRTARENLAEARALVAALAPADLSGGTLADALHRLADRCRQDAALAVTVTVTGTPSGHHPDLDVILLRAAQEALHNARRHAAAGTVRLTLTTTSDTVCLEVTDDGRGLDPATAERAGFGLRGIRQRAETSGGSLTLSTDPGPGTTLRVDLPLPPAATPSGGSGTGLPAAPGGAR